MQYTPARNYCKMNSENILLCNRNDIFQENNSQTIVFHVILWITTNTCNVIFREINSRNIFLVTEIRFCRKLIPKIRMNVCNLFWLECIFLFLSLRQVLLCFPFPQSLFSHFRLEAWSWYSPVHASKLAPQVRLIHFRVFLGEDHLVNRLQYGEQKTDKEKSHKGRWWECPGSVPG